MRYDDNQLYTVYEKPKDDDNFWSKIVWSTVSNAALKSKNDKSATSPASIELMISVKTLSRAVSVECAYACMQIADEGKDCSQSNIELIVCAQFFQVL